MEYAAPETTKAAVSLLAKAKGSAYVLAGGSDLLVRMRGGFIEPDLVVDIKRIITDQQQTYTSTLLRGLHVNWTRAYDRLFGEHMKHLAFCRQKHKS